MHISFVGEGDTSVSDGDGTTVNETDQSDIECEVNIGDGSIPQNESTQIDAMVSTGRDSDEVSNQNVSKACSVVTGNRCLHSCSFL